ncbi:MAG: NUDIX domain-containing protein [Gammaproteobacteria bacterium]|jgi:8-oxo-dGTP diphosphatase
MTETSERIRITPRAVIVYENEILLQHKVYEDGSERYVLPGGAIEPGETIEQALIRECQEEIGTIIMVEKLLHVADFFRERKTTPPTRRQQVELLFQCRVPENYLAQNGPAPDKHQVAVEWVALSQLQERLYPPAIVDKLLNLTINSPVYLGLIE